MRSLLSKGERPPSKFMRAEVADALILLLEKDQLFVGEK